MTNEQLCVKAQAGNLDARNELIVQNIDFLHSQAWELIRKYPNYDIRENDLVQEGCFGLLYALKDYDPERGNKFLTYATWWIVKYMRKHIKGVVKNQPPVQTIHHTIWQENRLKADERKYDLRQQEICVFRYVRVEQLYAGFRKLTPRQQEYLRYRFGFDEEDHERSMKETAEYFHLRLARAKKLEREALNHLRHYILHDNERRPAPPKPEAEKILIGW